MYRFKLVTSNTMFGRALKFNTIDGARKSLYRILGTEHPQMDPDGYAVGTKGQCLFFLDGLTFKDLF